MKMLKLQERTERTEKMALGLTGNGVGTQSLDATDTVYCSTHGIVKGFHGHCEECFDVGYRDWIAVQSVKSLIPSWVGINVDGRQVIVAPVSDALDAVQTISRYKDSNAIVLVVWGKVCTMLNGYRPGHVGPSWTLPDADEDSDFVTCARCGQDFRPLMGDERVCDECYRIENGPRW